MIARVRISSDCFFESSIEAIDENHIGVAVSDGKTTAVGINIGNRGMRVGIDSEIGVEYGRRGRVCLCKDACGANGIGAGKLSGGYAGVVLRFVNRVLFSNNQVFNDGASSTATYGLYVYQNVRRATITGNNIYNSGQGGVLGVGIFLFAGVTNILINGNQVYDDQETRTMAYAIGGNANSGIVATNNIWGPAINTNPVAPGLLGGCNVFLNNQVSTIP